MHTCRSDGIRSIFRTSLSASQHMDGCSFAKVQSINPAQSGQRLKCPPFDGIRMLDDWMGFKRSKHTTHLWCSSNLESAFCESRQYAVVGQPSFAGRFLHRGTSKMGDFVQRNTHYIHKIQAYKDSPHAKIKSMSSWIETPSHKWKSI